MLPRYHDVLKNLTPDDFYDGLSETLSKGQLRMLGSSNMGLYLILP